MKRTVQQNKLYHEFCGLLHKQKEVSVWDGEFELLGYPNPFKLKPMCFSYDGFRQLLAQLNLMYKKDENGVAVSSTKLTIEEMNSHILFLEVLTVEFD